MASIFSMRGFSKTFVFFGLCGFSSFASAQEVKPLDMESTTPTLENAAPSNALEAAQALASAFDSVSTGMSSNELLAALQDAADAGQPIALWRLGTMYENGEGVQPDKARAFGYFSRIANEHANTPPKSLEADIVAQSFVKIGEYYNEGLPDAGIEIDSHRANVLLLHAASYFGDADAQYKVGRLYLAEKGLGVNGLQSARWLSLSARKGHVAAQATLGNILFNGEVLERQAVDGLMWLTVANKNAYGTLEQAWVGELLNNAMSLATPEERTAAISAAETLGAQFGG